ncbi:MAG: Ig-like domain-containing protein [Verrucomicrobiota bacterium]|jgi:plastocyanin
MNVKPSTHRVHGLVLYGLAGWALACPLSAQAANTNVDVSDGSDTLAFLPDAVTINVGDQVTWIWTGTLQHSATSETGVWNSGVLQNPATYSFTFTNAGSYPYYCVIHGFTGSVTVQAANVPPSVAITAPTNGATFAAPWTGAIQAAVSDPDDSVSKVDFFAGATRLGTVTNPPASPSFTVTNLPAGNYTLTAVATASMGATNTSAGVAITVVTPAAIVLSSPQRVSATAFQFNYSANTGLSYVVFRSGAWSGFSPISTNTAGSNKVNFLDNSATAPMNFYRVHLVPNP